MKYGLEIQLYLSGKLVIINKRNFVDYSLLITTIALSGIPYFTASYLFLPLGVLLGSVFILRRKSLDKEFLIFLFALSIITISQTLVFDFFSFSTVLGVYLRIIIGYLIVKILEENFLIYYVKILYYMALSSLFIFTTVSIIPGLGNLFINTLVPIFSIFNISGSVHETILIYNLSHVGLMRNSGPFWEPGAFAGYLIIAFIFNQFIENKNQKKYSIVIILATFTTFSSTAFIALSVSLFFFYYKTIKNIFIKIGVITVLISGSYYAYFNFDFLGKKIESQLSMAEYARVYEGGDDDTQRFINILKDVKDFKGHELVGRGSNSSTRYSYDPENQIRTVGITDIIVRMGIPFFLFMMYFLYKSVCSFIVRADTYKRLYCIGSILTIIVTLLSEVYFNFPIYWSLLFLFFIYKERESK